MVVPPHPHTGLQTVSWLFEGEIEHRDSVGIHALVRPRELNLMTAGHGIAHSEISRGDGLLHGAQLWVALPDAPAHHAPFFERTVPTPIQVGRCGRPRLHRRARPVTLAGHDVQSARRRATRPARRRHGRARCRSGFEHGVLVDAGEVRVDGEPVPPSHLAYLAPGTGSRSNRRRTAMPGSCCSAASRSPSTSSCGGTSSAATTTRSSRSASSGRPM